ncbi:MAG: nucleotidyltransferase domain-containing protein [Desulfohalobiaceae bacterium]
MRLSEKEKKAIKEAVRKHFGPRARVYLFGSRVDDDKLGGDIDLYVETELQGEAALQARLRAISSIQLSLGERKIDLLTSSPDQFHELPEIFKLAKKDGICL